MKGYSKAETQKLIKLALEAEKSGASLSKVFEKFANATGRATGSVRNYYYQLLKNENAKSQYTGAGELVVGKNVKFDNEELEKLEKAVEEGVKKGASVRHTLMLLAHGDAKLALRYQNKYRNIQKSKNAPISRNKDKQYELLASKINDLIERIGKELREENERLKTELERVRPKFVAANET